MTSAATRYDMSRCYGRRGRDLPTEPHALGAVPTWLAAIVRSDNPETYSRALTGSFASYTEASTARIPGITIITDVLGYQLQDSKSQHVKTLSLTIAPTVDCLSPDIVLAGDWVFFWIFTDQEQRKSVIERIKKMQPCNRFEDGLRFLGRVHAPRKSRVTHPDGATDVQYTIQALGFNELDTQLFYDRNLATLAAAGRDISEFMAQIGLDWTKWATKSQLEAGEIKDNANQLIPALIDALLGHGIAAVANKPLDDAIASATKNGPIIDRGRPLELGSLKVVPQADRQAPFAYVVPREVGLLLGRKPRDASKAAGQFGYADILDTLIGVQKYKPQVDPTTTTFYPSNIDAEADLMSRHFCDLPVKGTFLPVEPNFVGHPVWDVLKTYSNHAINEMYTAMKPNAAGEVLPTFVLRQIPFSTESIEEDSDFPLTRFMSLPRWVVPPAMVFSEDLGRSGALRTNFMHVYGDAAPFSNNIGVTEQMVLNPPIFDKVDIARNGMHLHMDSVQCSIVDQTRTDGARTWMKAMADWEFGSHLTYNGSITVAGTSLPVCPGDNLEHDEIVYHIENITHTGQVDAEGRRTSRTTFHVSNGMPADQSLANEHVPVYPGFARGTRQLDPGTSTSTRVPNVLVGPAEGPVRRPDDPRGREFHDPFAPTREKIEVL